MLHDIIPDVSYVTCDVTADVTYAVTTDGIVL